MRFLRKEVNLVTSSSPAVLLIILALYQVQHLLRSLGPSHFKVFVLQSLLGCHPSLRSNLQQTVYQIPGLRWGLRNRLAYCNCLELRHLERHLCCQSVSLRPFLLCGSPHKL